MLIKINLEENEDCTHSTSKIKLKENKKYSITTEVAGFLGLPFSAYFGIILYQNDKPIGRKIRWLNDFSGNKKKYQIVITLPSKCDMIRCVYRINNETPLHSKCSYQILPIDKIPIIEEIDLEERYDLPNEFVIPRLEELSVENESLLEKNLVWIFGSRRSGTTWLGRDLLSFNTKFMNEPLIGKIFDLVRESSFDPLKRYIDLHKNDASYFFSNQYKKTWIFYLRKLILNRIHVQFQTISQKIIIKEPNGSSAADIISECFPDSKMIFLFRDGRDIIDSNLDARIDGGWFTKNENLPIIDKNKRISFIEEKAEEWVNIIEILQRAFRNHPQNKKLFLKYENLRQNTFENLKLIYSFIDIQISDLKIKEKIDFYSYENIPNHLKGEGKFIRTAQPGKWISSFSEEEKKILLKIMESTLQKLGYK